MERIRAASASRSRVRGSGSPGVGSLLPRAGFKREVAMTEGAAETGDG